MLLHHVVDAAFTEDVAQNCSLVQVKSPDFRYYLSIEHNTQLHKLWALASSNAGKPKIPWLKYAYHDSQFIDVPPYHLLVPSGGYSAKMAPSLMQQHVGSKANKQKLRHEEMPQLSAFLITPKNSRKAQHSSTRFLLNFDYAQLLNQYPSCLRVDLRIDHLLVNCYVDGKLQLSNTFPFHSREDILYYILSTLEKHLLSPHEAPVLFTGYLRSNTKLMQMLKQYLDNLEILRLPASISMSKAFKEVPMHWYFSGLIAQLCE